MVSCLCVGDAVLFAQYARTFLWDFMMPPSKNTAAQVIIIFLLGWILAFNLFMKQQDLFHAFFQLINTVSEDLVMGGGTGLIASVLFGVCAIFGNVFAQFLSRRDFFGCLDNIIVSGKGIIECLSQIVHIEGTEQSDEYVPSSGFGIVLSLSFIYAFGLLTVFTLTQPIWTYVSSSSDVRGAVLFALVPLY